MNAPLDMEPVGPEERYRGERAPSRADAAAAATREPPHNFEAEQAVLGAVLFNNSTWHEVAELVGPQDFADPLHGKIWDAMARLIERGMVASEVTLKSALEHERGFGNVSAYVYLGNLVAAAVSVPDARDYARTVRDCALRRGLIEIAANITTAAFDGSHEKGALRQVEQAEADLFQLASTGRADEAVDSQGAVAAAVIEDMERRYKDPDRNARAVTSGIAALDERMTLEVGDFLVIAGSTSMGKSALADGIAEANELRGIGTAIFPLEMTSKQWTQRRLSRITGISLKRILRGEVSAAVFDRVMEAAAELRKRPCAIGNSFGLTPASLRARLRRLKRQHDIGLVIVDYIQLMQADQANRNSNRTQDIGHITRSLRLMAGELGIVMIGVSQLSRGIDAREDKRPVLGDLRESGSIEQDATHVLMVYREEYFLSRSKPHGRGGKEPSPQEAMDYLTRLEASRGVAELIIPKQRNDEAPVTVRCAWDGMRTRFSDIALDTPGGAMQGEFL